MKATRGSGDLARDEGGAIIVIGIFMCVFLVGALWYIAGIGDAIIFRERMEEASDAVAFSTAVLEARGMNILVLLNLIMAAIEAILVVTNLIMFATLLFAGIMAAIGAGLDAVSFGTAGAPFFALALEAVNFEQGPETSFHDVVKDAVYDALEAIHDVEQQIPKVVPPIAQAASYEVTSLYQPAVNAVASTAAVFMKGTFAPVGQGKLPVINGTTHKLCTKAFDAVAGVMNDIVSGAGSVIISPIETLASALGVSDYFCELGDSSQAPDMSQTINDQGDAKCDSDPSIKGPCDTAAREESAVAKLQSKCAGWIPDAIPPQTPPDPQCPNLQANQEQADADTQTCNDKKNDCHDKVHQQTQKAQNQANSSQSNQGNGNGKEPAAVDHDNWWSGCDQAQIFAVAEGDGKTTTYSPRFVKYASQGGVTMNDPEVLKGQTTSASQAEFFYDCPGAWDDCDKEEDAMWNFHWRARLRLVNPGLFGPGDVLWGIQERFAVKTAADLGRTTRGAISFSPARVQFTIDLANVTLSSPTSNAASASLH